MKITTLGINIVPSQWNVKVLAGNLIYFVALQYRANMHFIDSMTGQAYSLFFKAGALCTLANDQLFYAETDLI